MALVKQITYEEFRKSNPDIEYVEGSRYYSIEICKAFASVTQDNHLEFHNLSDDVMLTEEQEADIMNQLTPTMNLEKDRTFLEKEFIETVNFDEDELKEMNPSIDEKERMSIGNKIKLSIIIVFGGLTIITLYTRIVGIFQ